MSPEIPLEVDCQTVAGQLGQAPEIFLLDCREADEFAIAKIAGAELLPMSELMARVQELEPYRNRPLVVHCHHGGRSLKVAQWLRNQGFPQAQSMAGGIDQWAREIDTSIARY